MADEKQASRAAERKRKTASKNIWYDLVTIAAETTLVQSPQCMR